MEKNKYPDQWVYETKCRRCGKFEEWTFSTRTNIVWTKFAEAMTDHIQHPRLLMCEQCNGHTIQDIISYTDAFE